MTRKSFLFLSLSVAVTAETTVDLIGGWRLNETVTGRETCGPSSVNGDSKHMAMPLRRSGRFV